MLIAYLVVAAISLPLSIRNIAACNEYYKIKVLGDNGFNNNNNYAQNNMNYDTNAINFNQNNMNYNQNAINYNQDNINY